MSATNRNQPCLCGSGRKHKKCCGEPTKLQAQAREKERIRKEEEQRQRAEREEQERRRERERAAQRRTDRVGIAGPRRHLGVMLMAALACGPLAGSHPHEPR